MKKRLMSLLLAVSMVASMIVVPAAAADPVAVSVDSVSGKPGETVTVGINLENLTDDQYIGAFQIDISFDTDDLESVAIRDGRKDVQILQNKDFWEGGTFQSTLKTGMVSLGAMNSDGWPGSGKIGEMQFKIKEDVSVEETELTVTLKKITLLEMDNSQTDITADITAKNGTVDVIFPVTATTGDAVQKTVTSAVLSGSYTENVGGLTIEASGIKWGTAENALTNTAEFDAEVTAAQGSTIFYQAYAKVDGVEYVGEVKSIVLDGPKASAIEISGADSIEVTFEDNTTTYTAAVKDQFGGAFETTVEWSLVDAPAGVSISDAGVVTVTKAAQSGNVTVKATAGTAEATKTVSINRPAPVVDAITITDIAPVAVPTAAVGTATVELTATGVDQFAETITLDNVQWSISAAEGVSINGNVITVTNKAAAGTVTVTANVNGVTDTFELNITKADPVATTVSFKDGENATISIPTSDTPNTRVFEVVVTDQFGDEMDAEVAFTMTGDEFVSAAGNTVTVKMGATKDTVYTMTATAGAATDSIEIKVVDIDITWGAFTENANAVYGMTWGQIVTVAPGTAKLDGVDVPGTWTVVDADVAPNAGEQTYTVKFASNDGNYVVTTTDTATIAAKAITATWSGYNNLTFNGAAASVTATLNGVLADDDVTLTYTGNAEINAGSYTAEAALAGADKDNYTLTGNTQAYTINKANATLTVPADSICAGNTADYLAAYLNAQALKATGVNGAEIPGTVAVTTPNIENIAAGRTQSINLAFTPANAIDVQNYNAITGTVSITFTDGLKQTIAVEDITATYGDANKAIVASVTEGVDSSLLTFASDNANVAVVNDDNTVTFVGAGEAKITVTAPADKPNNWAETKAYITVTVAPKAVTITGAAAENKVYDGKTDAVISSTEYTVSGLVAGDVVTVDATNAKAAFADANVGTGKAVSFTGFAITGEDAKNYTLSAQPADAAADITKTPAADVKVELSNGNQAPGENVQPVVPVITPAVADESVTVYYYVVKTPAVDAKDEIPCGHAEDKTNCAIPEGECDHTDNCGYAPAVEAKPAEYEWTTTVPTEAGTYPVKVVIAGDPNVEDTTVEGLNLVLQSFSGGGGGGGALTMAITVDKSKNGSISLSNKFAPKDKEVTITVKPDEGYELKSITVTDAKGNEVEVTEKNGKYVFKMPATKVTITPVFGLIDEESASDVFVDLVDNSWYSAAVDAMVENGLMAGVSEDKFAPEMNLTRSMVVQILWAMSGKPVVNYALTFEDVPAGAWYTEAVRWAASEGVVSGYSAETFGSNDAVTREQLAVMLYAYARKQNVDVSIGENTNILSYNDAFSISEWAIPAMQWACGEGLISGTPAGDLLPANVATRAQVAVILNNFYDLING